MWLGHRFDTKRDAPCDHLGLKGWRGLEVDEKWAVICLGASKSFDWTGVEP